MYRYKLTQNERFGAFGYRGRGFWENDRAQILAAANQSTSIARKENKQTPAKIFKPL